MNRDSRNKSGRWFVAGVLALAALSAYAVDVVVRPGAGDAFSVVSQTDLELFRVAETGAIILPQQFPMVAGSEALCRAVTGEVVRCVDSGSGYQVVEEVLVGTMQLPQDRRAADVSCPAGTRVVSGGYWNRSISTDELYVSKSQPALSGTGWEVEVVNASGGSYNLNFEVRVVCANI